MTEPDASLVARVRMGDAAAFEVLLRRYFRAAYLVALARVSDRDEAEDICQEAFLRSWEHIQECRDPSRFGGWLIRIVRNLALNRREYLALRITEPLDDVALAAAPDRTERHAELEALRETLRRALAQLSMHQREIVLLHDLEGWTHAEIASRLDISELMSRRHLSDARKRLRMLLGDQTLVRHDHD
ncbi:MAG TPA: RNA polymerase sigma factor [Gemmatimonadaceae bacterium]|nr:RNA polymerase sigma factor [Gemmatimonadaceae bacterium]